MGIMFYGNSKDPFEYGLSVTGSTADILLDLMDIESDYCGRIPIGELESRIQRAKAYLCSHKDEFSRSPSISYGPNGAKCIHGGMTTDRLIGYLDHIQLIGDDARSHGMTFINWA